MNNGMNDYFLSGSVWKIWDLHVHSPASFGGNDYPTFITNLSQSEADVIGINDYCTIEGYSEILKLGGVPGKVIFPVVEFRMNNIVANRKGASPSMGGTKINFHLIFNNDPELFLSINTFINSLPCFNSNGDESLLGSIPKSQLAKITFDYAAVLKKLSDANLKEHCIFWLPYDEYGGIDEIDPEDNFFKLHLIKKAQILGSSREAQINYFKWKDTKFSEQHYREIMDFPKPCIKGSDSHALSYPFGRLKNEKSEPTEKYCWIKGECTFNGLKQILFEPDRVYIGKEPELLLRVKNSPHKFIKKLEIDKEDSAKTAEIWFQNIELEFNYGLVAIIGKKGNGKSAIADIIGLCGNSRNNKEDLSFLHKDKFKSPRNNKAKDFKANLKWADNSQSDFINLSSDTNNLLDERVKYIPQNYLEKLCVNEEQKEFEEELKKIIFAHIPIEERLGQSSLDDLIELKKKATEDIITSLKNELSSVNKTIARLEIKLKPSYKSSIEHDLVSKEADLKYHELNRPIEKLKPDEDFQQKQKNAEIIDQIELKSITYKELNEQKKNLEEELRLNNIKINELENIKSEFVLLEQNVQKSIANRKEQLEKYDIDISDVISITINSQIITDKVDALKLRNRQIIISQTGNEEFIGLDSQLLQTETAIQELHNQLAQNQKEYLDYILALDAWSNRRNEIIGSADQVGSLEFYRNELNHINQVLPGEINLFEQKRMSISQEIYSQKSHLLDIYKTLYRPVTTVLQNESSFVEDYNIKVNASLVTKVFSDKFLGFVNQKSRGSFAGAVEGKDVIDNIISVSSFENQFESEIFINTVVEFLKKDKRIGSIDETRYVDEQLKKDLKVEELYDFLFSLDYLEPQFKLQLGSKDLKELSPGERGAILLIFYLFLDVDNKPLVIDQPEENLDNESIYYYLVHFIKKAKQKRQIMLITHNPNLAVVCDADQIIHMSIDKQNQNKVTFVSGAIENPEMAKRVVNILEGTKPAFDNRRLKYASLV